MRMFLQKKPKIKITYFIVFTLLIAGVILTVSAGKNAAVSAHSFRLIYVVQEGDTLVDIARGYEASPEEIKLWNDIDSFTALRVGEEIEIPLSGAEKNRDFSGDLTEREKNFSLSRGKSHSVRINPREEEPDIEHIGPQDVVTYHVQAGDTLYDISRRFNTSVGAIKSLNDMDDSIVRRGEELDVPVTELTEREVLSRSITDEEFELLARIVHSEAKGEPHQGRIAVGAVVINRVMHPDFPDTIEGVIYDRGQFSPVADGSYREPPSPGSRQAAREALQGMDPTGGALYFYNPDKATDVEWTTRREKIVTIGNHVFMR